MSTATSVPETYELEGDDAIQTLRNTGWAQLAKDSFVRFRAADGTSHSRSLAFQVMLALLPFVIAVVGLTTVLNIDEFRQLLTQTVDRLAPGPAGQIFTQAISQGAKSAARGGVWALLLGAVAALASATVAMGQIERGANRLYGVEAGPPHRRQVLERLQARLHRRGALGGRLHADRRRRRRGPGRRAVGRGQDPLDPAAVAAQHRLRDRGLRPAVQGRPPAPPAVLVVAGRRVGRLGAALVRVHRPPGALPGRLLRHLRPHLRAPDRRHRHPDLDLPDLAGHLPRAGLRGPAGGGQGRDARPQDRRAGEP